MPKASRIFCKQYFFKTCKFGFDVTQIFEFVSVFSNGAVIKCPGLLHGEVMIMLEPRAKSIVALMMATNPNLEYITAVFTSLSETFYQRIQLHYHI